MKAVEEPACLSVGTDVSAKYRGAFCEAKIKTVKRLVKVKVNLKAEGTSQVVQDDQVKGPLRVGSVVEVRTTEGGSSEAVISKLTDASLYTVVFDDGDEKTLRRTSLCLKGERHFAESETLDQLPLTNPEHFGTPVIGKKSNRGRRSSQAVADEENESSSSEEEDEERRVAEELLGKVCSVDGPEPGGLVLVVSPGCNEELQVKKDHCLVRSFADGKFSTAPHRNLNTLVSTSACKLSNRTGAEAAQCFLRSGAVPNVWKMDLSQILESSSDSDDKHSEEEEAEEEKKRKAAAEAEPEEELDPEERDLFLQQLYKFMEDRATPINKPPVLGYKDLNLFKLFRLVTQHGGYGGIESGAVWKQIYMDLGIPVLNSAAAYNVKTAYRKYLFGFEEYCRSALITFRTIHHNNPRSPDFPASPTRHPQRAASETKASSPSSHRAEAEHKSSPLSNQRAAGADLKDAVKLEPEAESESDSEREELLTSPRGRRRCVIPLKDEQRDARKRTPRQNDQSEHMPRLSDQSERGGRFTDQSERGSEDEDDDDEEDEEGRLLNPTERGDSDPEADSLAGTRVRVKYGRGKTQKIYEAHIKKTDNDNGENFYLVHYYGWNVRYDEWVKADRIIWPSEKGSKKKRGKLKNKDEPDGEEERPLKGPGRRGRPLGSKNKTNGRSAERREPGTAFANGDTPRRRTRRTSGMFDSDRASNEDSGNSSDDSESEDSMEKKPFPWRRAEAGLKQEVDRSPGQEEEDTPPSEAAAPGQSQPRAEPEPAVTLERKDVAPPSDAAAPKLKLPLMVLPPRSEPMVLLHHCLPPDSDTDSASESDSEREDDGQEDDGQEDDGQEDDGQEDDAGEKGDANEGEKGDANRDAGKEATEAEGQTEETQEDTKDTEEEVNDEKDDRTEEEPDKNNSAKSPLRHANVHSTRSPQKEVHARSPQKDLSTRSPQKEVHARSPQKEVHARSPQKEVHARSPQKELGVRPSIRSPQKDLGARSPQKDLSARSPQKDLGARSPQKDLGARSPQKDLSARSPQKDLGARSPQKDLRARSPQKDLGARSPQKDLRARSPQKDLGARSPQKDLGAGNPQKDLGDGNPQKDLGARSPQKDLRARSPQKDLGARSPQKDLGARSPQKDLGARSPQKDLGARSPQKDLGARSPQKDVSIRSPQKDLRARSPQKDLRARSPQKDLGARSPQKDVSVRSPQKDVSVRSPQKVVSARSPPRDKLLSEKRPADSEVVNSPRRLDKTPQDTSPKPEENTLPNAPDAETSQTETTPTKPDTNTAGKSPNPNTVEPETSPNREESEESEASEEPSPAEESAEGNTPPLKRKAPEQKTPDKKLKTDTEEEELKPAEEESGERCEEAESVPEMGVDALVCHEVDLDEPDEREKVSASEQLLLMRESHLLRAPPLQEAHRGEPREAPRGGQRHEDNAANGDRGQKRVLEGPHSPTVKKHKRPSHKRLTPNKPDKNGAGHSSDSEDQSHKHCPSPTSRGHKWTLHIDDLEKMSSSERISFLQDKLQEIRKYYLSLKSEVASIDRRRKRLKKKEREVSNTASASSSSDAAMSPSSSSPSQSSLAVEVR